MNVVRPFPRWTLLLLLCSLTVPAVPTGAAEPTEALHRWLFDAAHVKSSGVMPAGESALAAGVVEGDAILVGQQRNALLLDGKATVVRLVEKGADLGLPTNAISVEAWFLLTHTRRHGAVVGGLRVGRYSQRGFSLGYHNSRLRFGVATRGTGNLTYVGQPDVLKSGQWIHAVGTYDGKVSKLFVDGEEVALNEAPEGELIHLREFAVEVGRYRDRQNDPSTRGFIAQGLVHEVALYGEALSAAAVRERYAAKQGTLPPLSPEVFGPFLEVRGPFVEYPSDGGVRISWGTESPCPTIIDFAVEGEPMRRFDLDESAKGGEEALSRVTEHAITLPSVPRDRFHEFRIWVGERTGLKPTRKYRCDGAFQYFPGVIPWNGKNPYPEDERTGLYERTAQRIVAESKVRRGYAVVLGAADGRLAFELARRTELQVIAIAADADEAQRVCQNLDEAGLHGTRVTVLEVAPGEPLPLPRYLANLVVSDSLLTTGKFSFTGDDVLRLVRPYGGVAFLGASPEVAEFDARDFESWVGSAPGRHLTSAEGTFWVYRRGAVDGAGEWNHQYGSANNSACSDDDLVKGELGVLWFGRPGARPMPDRGPRNPAPLFSAGRLFVQGDRSFFGLDAYNGTLLWAFQAPEFRRANLPRDCSNMTASKEFLYIVGRSHAYAVSADTGSRDLVFRLPRAEVDGVALDWGYVAHSGSVLVGSATVRGSGYVGDDGQWYEGMADDEVGKVSGEYLFGYERLTGETLWVHDKGVIVHSTITIQDDTVVFVESRDPALESEHSGRFQQELPNVLHLVALELTTGQEKWAVEFDFSKCRHMLYLAAGGDTLVAAGTDPEKNYHVYGFSLQNGYKLWEHTSKARKTHHSGHLSHPVIVGDRIYVNLETLTRASGEVEKVHDFNYHGCGVMAASKHTIFQRFEHHGVWDLETDERKEILGLRSGCWLGIIPAGGILLAPESSAGCSCAHAIQTTAAYAPREVR
jgi:outer membrane protein assembly factor BamB